MKDKTHARGGKYNELDKYTCQYCGLNFRLKASCTDHERKCKKVMGGVKDIK